MDFTPRLNLPYIAPQQAQKQVTYNEAMRALDQLVQPVVLSRSLSAPPGSPASGDAYLVAAAATGAWMGKSGLVASFIDGAWSFRTPLDGWMLYVTDDDEFVQRRAGAWGPAGSHFATLGVNATADLTNRLSVAAASSLFSHDGAGHRLAVNKATGSDTASQLFQVGYSARAEIGLLGDNHLHLKVSSDGSTWYEGMAIEGGSGRVSLPAGQLTFPATQNASSDPNTLDDYEEGTWTPSLAFGGNAVGITYGSGNAGSYTKIGRVVIAKFLLQLTSKGSSTGTAVIGGLPFPASSSAVPASMATGWCASLSSVTGAVQGTLGGSGAGISLYGSSGGASLSLSNIYFTNTSQILGAVSYET